MKAFLAVYKNGYCVEVKEYADFDQAVADQEKSTDKTKLVFADSKASSVLML